MQGHRAGAKPPEQRGTHQVIAINNADPDKTRAWAQEVDARFPVLAQEKYAISKRFEAYATPFAFLIDEQGIIRSKGIAGSKQHLNFVLSGAGTKEETNDSESPAEPADGEVSATSVSHKKEVQHV